MKSAHTRAAYYRAIGQFLTWLQHAGYRHIQDIEPATVAAYIEMQQRQAARQIALLRSKANPRNLVFHH